MYVDTDNNFNIHEKLFVLYNIEGSSGKSISAATFDALVKFDLPIENLRAQTYDGAANMTGRIKRCQEQIKNNKKKTTIQMSLKLC